MIEYKLGALPDLPDARDYILADYIVSVELPRKVDFSPAMTPVKYQANLGSCVAFSALGVKEYQDSQEMKKVVDLSEQWLYGECKKRDHYSGEGTYPRTAMDVLLKLGTPEEAYMPYEGEYPPHNRAKEGAIENALKYRTKSYASIGGSVEDVKQAIYQLGPVMISIWVYDSFIKPVSGVVPMPGGNKRGGHALVACGYDDDFKTPWGTGVFLVKNSWSKNWGVNGYCYIPYVVWDKIGLGGWSMIDLVDGIMKHWRDWPDEELEAQDKIYRLGYMRGYPDGTFHPWDNMTKRQVSTVAHNMGKDVKILNDYSVASRGWVRDFIPLTWNEERWDEPITRFQFLLLLARL